MESLKELEKKNKTNIATIVTLPIEKRLNTVKEIFCIGNRILKGMLTQPSKNGIIIDIAFEKAFKYFLNHVCKNRF